MRKGKRLLSAVLSLAMCGLLAGGAGAAEKYDGYTAVSTPQELKNMANDLSGRYYLANDLDLSGEGNWTPLGSAQKKFTGILDGRGHQIRGMQVAMQGQDTGYAGLFGYSAGEIRSLHLLSFTIALDGCAISYAGGITGAGSGAVENCSAVGKITVKGQKLSLKAGGIAGRWYAGDLKGCYSAVSLSAEGSGLAAGGIAGQSSGNIQQCGTASGLALSGAASTFGGGIAGMTDGTVTDSYQKGAVALRSGKDGFAGGIAGQNKGKISRVVSWGSVQALAEGETHTGGVEGVSEGGALEYGYYLTEDGASAGGFNEAGLNKQATFAGFDFDGVWIQKENAPDLRVFDSGDMWPQGLRDVTIKVGELKREESPSGTADIPLGEPQGSLLGNAPQGGGGQDGATASGEAPAWLIWLLAGIAAAAGGSIAALMIYDRRKAKKKKEEA